ncbi:hypothetical protein BJY04DRAFT_181 [Aspergillus karnatakaensis]|uniref:uncharacterized protein n=1 Tax=Aspergillus karnatakaensis TaxID=1810916 RepID=UPI003CCE3956
MYLIGNFATYSNVEMWSKVLGILRLNNSIGTTFNLCCPRHPETAMSVSSPEEFDLVSPQGGCRLKCIERLERCGHECRSMCHFLALHQAFRCPAKYERLFDPCGHGCPESCGDPCGLCKTVVPDVFLPCGHTEDRMPCHESQNLGTFKCSVKVMKVVPQCGHGVEVACHQDVGSSFLCPKPCSQILRCGHECHGTCGRCPKEDVVNLYDITAHQECKRLCGRKYRSCSHICPRTCHSGMDCGLCEVRCEVQCPHSRCSQKWSQPCTPCVEQCTWSCEHQARCTLPCAAPCDRLPCLKRCAKDLKCGHQCPGVCGETCPDDYCQICSGRGNTRIDMLELKTYAEVNLDETPIIVLRCGHFFTTETLDGYAAIHGVYEQNAAGDFIALRESAKLWQFVPRCPDCQAQIRQYSTQRYNRVINKAVLDETTRGCIVSGTARLRHFTLAVNELEKRIQTSKEEHSPGPNISNPTENKAQAHRELEHITTDGQTASGQQAWKVHGRNIRQRAAATEALRCDCQSRP